MGDVDGLVTKVQELVCRLMITLSHVCIFTYPIFTFLIYLNLKVGDNFVIGDVDGSVTKV